MKCERLIINMNKNIIPITVEIVFKKIVVKNNISVEKNNQKMLIFNVSFLKDKGVRIEASPKTRRIFEILLPTTLPQAIPGDFSSTALTDTTNSGNDVPNAIMVIAISCGFILRLFAVLTDPETNFSPP